MKKGSITIFEANIIYMAVAILLVTIGSYAQFVNIKLGLIITEYILIVLPVVIVLKIKNISINRFLRFNKLKIKHGLIIIVITLLIYPVAAFLNLMVLAMLSYFGFSIQPSPIPSANNLIEYTVLFFIIAISAGICEEIFFRGLLLRVYGEKYKVAGVVITSIMFGIFHFNLQNLVAPIVLGFVFGYLVYITDSIYAGIVGHITNNGIALTLMYILSASMEKLNQYGEVIPDNITITPLQYLILSVILGGIAIITGIIAYLLIKQIKKDINNDLNISEGIYNNSLTLEAKYNQNLIRKEDYRLTKFIPVMIVIVMYIIFSYLQFSRYLS